MRGPKGRSHQGAARRHGERGLALLDVLIGMAMFALVTLIAISTIDQYRERAWEADATAAARSVGTGLESVHADHDAYPDETAVELTASEANSQASGFYRETGVRLTEGLAVSDYVVTASPTGQTFVVCVTHDNGPWAKYDSAAGTIVDHGRAGACVI